MEYQRAKRLLIRDEIHGDMSFDPVLEAAIDHECVQRLRGIKQLGLAEYIFPCATHTRFQHSLGASYLAGRYFRSFTEQWLSSPLHVKEKCGGTRLRTEETHRSIREVVESSSSRRYWYQVVSLAGLLHDVGHGPFSHAFEGMGFRQDFGEALAGMSGVVREFLVAKTRTRFLHEDISLLYIDRILRDLEKKGIVRSAKLYSLAISGLVHRKLSAPPYQKAFEKELEALLEKNHVEGGSAFHSLLKPIISGPFDVDRMDYIQRDGRNCGVSIGAIEWRRIVSKLVPCLAEHVGTKGEPPEVVLLTSLKNQHVLDDFVFSLFQMYTQVYLHPKIVALEQAIKEMLDEHLEDQKSYTISLETHQSLNDEGLKRLLVERFGIGAIKDLFNRREGVRLDVASYPSDFGMEEELKKSGFVRADTTDRPMMKESMGVFLYSRFRTGKEEQGNVHLSAWSSVSPIAKHFYNVNYSPNFWIRTSR